MTVVDLYTIQIIDDRGNVLPPPPYPLARIVMDEMLSETEENLTDLLPAGYRARIRRWDTPYEEQSDDPPPHPWKTWEAMREWERQTNIGSQFHRRDERTNPDE